MERIIVIDNDLGQSGASAIDREGFQKLAVEVGIGKAAEFSANSLLKGIRTFCNLELWVC